MKKNENITSKDIIVIIVILSVVLFIFLNVFYHFVKSKNDTDEGFNENWNKLQKNETYILSEMKEEFDNKHYKISFIADNENKNETFYLSYTVSKKDKVYNSLQELPNGYKLIKK